MPPRKKSQASPAAKPRRGGGAPGSDRLAKCCDRAGKDEAPFCREGIDWWTSSDSEPDRSDRRACIENKHKGPSDALLEPFYYSKSLTDPIITAKDKWNLLPAFLKVRDPVKQHINSYNYFVESSIIRSDIDHQFYIKFTDIYGGSPKTGGRDPRRWNRLLVGHDSARVQTSRYYLCRTDPDRLLSTSVAGNVLSVEVSRSVGCWSCCAALSV